MTDWLPCLHERAHTLNVSMSEPKGVSLLDRFFCFSGESGEEGLGKDAGMTAVLAMGG